jgi:hypothetical protein
MTEPASSSCDARASAANCLAASAANQGCDRACSESATGETPSTKGAICQSPRVDTGPGAMLRMPYDESFEVRGVLKGCLSDESALPRTGNHIGDTWIVNNVPWVWITVPGTTAPAWVDP